MRQPAPLWCQGLDIPSQRSVSARYGGIKRFLRYLGNKVRIGEQGSDYVIRKHQSCGGYDLHSVYWIMRGCWIIRYIGSSRNYIRGEHESIRSQVSKPVVNRALLFCGTESGMLCSLRARRDLHRQ